MTKPIPEDADQRAELAAWLQKLDDAHQLCTCRSDCVECRECDHDYPCDIKKLLDVLERISKLNMQLKREIKLISLLVAIKDLQG